MSELLPTVQAENIRHSLVDYLTTTFALTDTGARDALDRFLGDPESGMFKGPYVRLRLPFRPADDGWRDSLEWYEGHRPYGHQAAAFARLSSLGGRRPQPTLVTTGTGSGKTEAFLYPIVDHVLRARREGITGAKALILYPMNALANDQAQRLTRLLTTHAELRGITAAIYTGQKGPQRTMVTADGLITDRGIIRDTAPDILLTNYKMLDQLLLRAADQDIWRQSARSLQYLVLDEFHTYDGAQGTDVAMLLRRLGLALKSHWPKHDATITPDDRARPLGRITPVATSATLGDKGDPGVMLDFAHTVFGEPFDDGAIITESRLSLDEWTAGAATAVADHGAVEIGVIDVVAANAAVEQLGTDPDPETLTRTVLTHLYDTVPDDPALLPDLCRAHPLVAALAREAYEAVGLSDLVRHVLGPTPTPQLAATGADPDWERFLSHVVAALGHVRTLAGRSALSVEAHLWVRELTRIDRAADPTAQFRWGDDGPPAAGSGTEDVRPAFPALYCRRCGRSGWGVSLAPVGTSLAVNDEGIRRDHAGREGRFRPLLYAGAAAEAIYAGQAPPPGLLWFSVRTRELLSSAPAEDDPDLRDGWVLPILTNTGQDADDDARNDTCPACGQADGIRFLGSAIATLLSVSLSTLFGSHQLNEKEKKALVFTDSVQDAAHRAGFVQARSHTLTLRAVLRAAVQDGPLALEQLVDEVIRLAGNDRIKRYRLLPPDCADRESFAPFWTSSTLRGAPQSVRTRVRRRLALDAALEFGLNSRTGRTLELTGAVAVEVDAGEPAKMAAAARTALGGTAHQTSTEGEHTDATLTRWVRGVLNRMRAQGAIDHPWFDKYRREDGNRWWVTGGRNPQDGMPAFPGNRPGRVGRPAPGYPRVGGTGDPAKADGLEPVTTAKSWYAQWTSKALDVSPHDGGRLARLLLDALARDGVLTTLTSTSGATVYAIPADGVVVTPTTSEDLAARRHLLTCDTCRDVVTGTPGTVDQLDGAPCMLIRCPGRLTPGALAPENFYRRLYASPDMRRVVAREHTSLLDDETRLTYENGFKGSDTSPQAPNVLVATPTLEMGIDIGDLSAVFLSSLPRTVAAYLQRVGRAGRLTGNALNLAYLTGRGEQLPKLGDPLSVINGEVRPPATYLRAEEILRRQYTAHLVDEFARDSHRRHPQSAPAAIDSAEPGSFLGDLIMHAEEHAEDHVARFGATFDDLPPTVLTDLSDWLTPPHGPGSSGYAHQLRTASARWQHTVETLRHRRTRIETLLPDLQAKADSSAATDDDRRALRSAQTALKLTRGQLAHLRGEYWIGVLEEHGLLPNYTLLDDSVTLDIGLSWTNPDTGKFETGHDRLQRGSAQAIREFAPGNRFYARGLEIAIDAVDLGVDRVAIRPWVFCPACGYAVDIASEGTEQHPQVCPRCGSTGIGDTGQRLDVVELTHVTAEIRRDEAVISDRRDQRDSRNFGVVTAADVDPAQIGRRWFVDDIGFGATFVRAMDLRWVNIGVPGHGSDRTIAGGEYSGALFRVCAGCGKLDTETGRNRPHEHRPWCRYRTATGENTTTVALSRTLRTQGLLLRLPNSVTIGDDFAVPSLSAAVLLGLREQLGGHPDHIRIEQVVDPTPSDGSENHQAVLLHDAVPGGTGYLAELADHDRLYRLLVTAWERVRDCECRAESRQACHRCLLPFVAPRQVPRASRASAERHLRTLLGVDPDGIPSAWTITDQPPVDDAESHLEQRFRKVLVERLRTTGATVTEVPSAHGNTVHVTLAGQHRHWTLTPQVNLQNSRPDFILETNDTTVPVVAIFTDGRAYHATVAHNRLADDAAKRQILRDTGRVVLAVTAADVVAAEKGTSAPPSWYNPKLVQKLITRQAFMASPAAYDGLRGGPVDWLIDWISRPSPTNTMTVARAVPLFPTAAAATVTLPDGASLTEAVRSVLLDVTATGPGGRPVKVWRSGACALAVEAVGASVHTALVLDDREAVLDSGHVEAWREWLRLSNALALRDWPTVITTTGLAAASEPVPTPAPTANSELTPEWQQIFDKAAPGVERELVAELARTGGLPLPKVGAEGPDGIPIDLSWPALQVAVAMPHMPAEDRADLTTAGWHLVEPGADVIATALADAGARGSQ
ncbi:DEAD/DEAH box helicase [Pseudonocardia sp. MH-G8]|uniref:DEAD/DEAH box helicase n=1 Tax=Pseudonocardia sp. MH-G8 TaxID=1854588 RepID=UPI000B9FA58C|nr:DEAD/DEAH box helicase [Pseudonocardia sp. MH-G8]OZM79674.1 heavy metal resistance protein CzcA [Pseudonocardia sp. MH-G8]